MLLYIYIYMKCYYIYIYIEIERERERERDRARLAPSGPAGQRVGQADVPSAVSERTGGGL